MSSDRKTIIYHPYDHHYTTLSEAIKVTPSGGNLVLGGGIYILKTPLVIEKTIHLKGSGRAKTIISYQGTGNAVTIKTTGRLQLSNLTFQHEGYDWGNVIVVETGEVRFHSCRFSGGKHDENRGGTGLLLLAQSKGGTIQSCVFSKNEINFSFR